MVCVSGVEMPRPRPPENHQTLHGSADHAPVGQGAGACGAPFLRKLIADHKPARGSSAAHVRWVRERNEAIAKHPGTCVEGGQTVQSEPVKGESHPQTVHVEMKDTGPAVP